MSGLINCKKCGSVFRKSFRDICPACIEKEFNQIKIINEYVKKHDSDGVSLSEISQELGISSSDIQLYISKGHLNEASSLIRQNCRICGQKLPENYSKQFVCAKCKEGVKQTIEEVKFEAKVNKAVKRTSGFKSSVKEDAKKSTRFGFKKNYD